MEKTGIGNPPSEGACPSAVAAAIAADSECIATLQRENSNLRNELRRAVRLTEQAVRRAGIERETRQAAERHNTMLCHELVAAECRRVMPEPLAKWLSQMHDYSLGNDRTAAAYLRDWARVCSSDSHLGDILNAVADSIEWCEQGDVAAVDGEGSDPDIPSVVQHAPEVEFANALRQLNGAGPNVAAAADGIKRAFAVKPIATGHIKLTVDDSELDAALAKAERLNALMAKPQVSSEVVAWLQRIITNRDTPELGTPAWARELLAVVVGDVPAVSPCESCSHFGTCAIAHPDRDCANVKDSGEPALPSDQRMR